jgi:hypothetical protein
MSWENAPVMGILLKPAAMSFLVAVAAVLSKSLVRLQSIDAVLELYFEKPSESWSVMRC